MIKYYTTIAIHVENHEKGYKTDPVMVKRNEYKSEKSLKSNISITHPYTCVKHQVKLRKIIPKLQLCKLFLLLLSFLILGFYIKEEKRQIPQLDFV